MFRTLCAHAGTYADDAYVPVAFGRDYDDVRPIRGIISGAAAAQSHEANLTMQHLPSQQ